MQNSHTQARIGNLFDSSAQTLVNTVNCVGVMGKGVAKEFKERFPTMFDDYANRCAEGQVAPGEPYHYGDLLGVSIVNFPTKKHWRSPSRIQDVINGLNLFAERFRDWEITSVAFPPLGCGNGGLEWELVGPLMYQKLSALDIPVEIYAPYGTPAKQLTTEFLTRTIEIDTGIKGKHRSKLQPGWVAILEVVKRLELEAFANPVGRTIFQKIC